MLAEQNALPAWMLAVLTNVGLQTGFCGPRQELRKDGEPPLYSLTGEQSFGGKYEINTCAGSKTEALAIGDDFSSSGKHLTFIECFESLTSASAPRALFLFLLLALFLSLAHPQTSTRYLPPSLCPPLPLAETSSSFFFCFFWQVDGPGLLADAWELQRGAAGEEPAQAAARLLRQLRAPDRGDAQGLPLR